MSEGVAAGRAVARGRRLLARLEAADDLPGAGWGQLHFRLRRALAAAGGDSRGGPAASLPRPVCIALVGGTGAGKSQLFCTLAGLPPEGLVSHDVRTFTGHAHVAVAADERAGLPLEVEPDALHEGVAGLALIDTPDLDGFCKANQRAAREAIGAADVIVFVTIPDKRSNFDLLAEVRQWAARKRWFFVLNKVDQVDGDDLDDVRRDFSARVAELGFEVRPWNTFLVSATEPGHPFSEYGRLRAAVYSSRTSEQVQALRDDAVLRELAATSTPLERAPMAAQVERLAAQEAELAGRVRTTYGEALSTRRAEEGLRLIVREAVWKGLPGRIGGPLAFAVWARARVNYAWAAVSLSRAVISPASPGGWLRAGWSLASSLLRGILPLHGILGAFDRRHREALEAVRRDALRALEDEGLPAPEAGEEPGGDGVNTAPAAAGEMGDEASTAGPAGAAGVVYRTFINQISGGRAVDTGVLAALESAVDGAAAEAGGRIASWVPRLFGNLLPLALGIDVVYRLLEAWIRARWLPLDFYFHSLVLFFFSLVPGYILLSGRVKRRAQVPDIEQVLGSMAEPAETAPLRAARRRLAHLLEATAALHRAAREEVDLVNRTLNPQAFGETLRAEAVPAGDAPEGTGTGDF